MDRSLGGVANDNPAIQAFTFGDPEPVLNRRELLDMVECYHNGRWYEPPISLNGLARAFRVSPHHSSAIMLKVNLAAASFIPSKLVSRQAFKAAVIDLLIFGNCYFETRTNLLGDPLRLDHSLAKYTRRGVKPGHFWFVPGYRQETEFKPGSVSQILQPDINQEIYGLPEYLSALQSALLNEDATLFRRRYYINGSHAGFILHAKGDFAEGAAEGIKEALKNAKGPGNFRNMFIHSPNGAKENGLELIRIAEVAAKDEFLGIKNTTRDDVLAAHRVPPQLLGIIPANAGGFGDPAKATDQFFELEIEPIQATMLQLNELLGLDAIAFKERQRAAA
ncbi:phage portal protein [Sphingomonas cavernae]|uniref:Phage portal protein n=1 Tax=Sphingomonas cavernae TaxID=2320861 RepID=A0A418WP09_9SPHN|nr:phage portal protein [Sphingomonas cavernae]RJF92971.1 phage portal protein [Sphingomonas cavernae]